MSVRRFQPDIKQVIEDRMPISLGAIKSRWFAGRSAEADGLALAARVLMQTQVPSLCSACFVHTLEFRQHRMRELTTDLLSQVHQHCHNAHSRDARLFAATAPRQLGVAERAAACHASGRGAPHPAAAHARLAWTVADSLTAEPAPDVHAAFLGKHALGVGLPTPDADYTTRTSLPATPNHLAELDPGTLLPLDCSLRMIC